MDRKYLSGRATETSLSNARSNVETIVRKCQDCGADISERGRNATRCKDCYRKYRRARNRELWRINKASRIKKQHEWNNAHKEKVKTYHHTDWEKHKQRRLELAERYYRDFTKEQIAEWRRGATLNGKLAEILASKILSAEGYLDVLRVNGVFPFDYLARKNGVHLIEVTTCYKKRLKDVQIKLAKYLDFPIDLLFIKPDGTKYRLVKSPQFRNSSVYSKYLKEPMKNIVGVG